MNPSKVIPPSNFRNHPPKPPDRHRRAYETAGQPWPENLGKHLRRAQAHERAERRVD